MQLTKSTQLALIGERIHKQSSTPLSLLDESEEEIDAICVLCSSLLSPRVAKQSELAIIDESVTQVV